MRRFILLALFWIGAAYNMVAQTNPPSATPLIWFWGQSNASGQGSIGAGGTIVVPATHAADLFLYTHGGQWWNFFEPTATHNATYGGEKYSVLSVSPVGSGVPGYLGPALLDAIPSFGKLAFTNTGVGSTKIVQWQPNTATTTLYGASMAQLASATVLAPLKAIVVLQGETDAKAQSDAQGWAANFTNIVTDLQSRFPGVPIFMVPLGDNPNLTTHPYWDTVKAQQNSISIPGVYVVSADGLAKQSDGLHYTDASYSTLAGRLLSAMVPVLTGSPPPPTLIQQLQFRAADPATAPDDASLETQAANRLLQLGDH